MNVQPTTMPRCLRPCDGLRIQARERIEPHVRAVKFIARRVVYEVAELKEDSAIARRLADDVMRELGFERARLGRIEFYLRGPGDRR